MKIVIPTESDEDSYKPIPSPVEKGQKWCFSFKYFNQIQYFGLQGTDATWFSSLLEKLKDLSNTKLDRFFKTISLQEAWRYHQIDWNARNVPVKREDFNWIDKSIIENDIEYPFWQFQISTALGRVVGFWNENDTVFHVVLLDPMHNIQPSSYTDYRLRPASKMNCKYSSLILDIEKIKKNRCPIEGCQIYAQIDGLPTNQNSENVLLAFIDDEYLGELQGHLGKMPFSEFIKSALIALA